jgi:hypothetical protein
LAFRYGNGNPGAMCLAVAGWTLWLLGSLGGCGSSRASGTKRGRC